MSKPSTPFSTGDGTPIAPTTGPVPRDLNANPTGSARDLMQQRPLPDTTAGREKDFRPERRQAATSFKDRVNAAELPPDGSPHPTAQAPAYRAGAGSLGNPRKPFKLSGG